MSILEAYLGSSEIVGAMALTAHPRIIFGSQAVLLKPTSRTMCHVRAWHGP